MRLPGIIAHQALALRLFPCLRWRRALVTDLLADLNAALVIEPKAMACA